MAIIRPRPSTLAQHAVDAGGLHRLFERICDRLLTWQERAHQRHHLEQLSDHMLRDIGLSRADIMAETTKRFWQP